MIPCAHCGATRRDVTLWDQIVHFGRGVVCCWAGGRIDGLDGRLVAAA